FEFDFTHIRTFLPERLPLAEQFYSCPASPQHSEPNTADESRATITLEVAHEYRVSRMGA
ncbi:MAG: hypothetical protein L0K29_10285, partial [Bifidobacterium crudilactis]|uniref:hypothetical protein n=1 Tax=Bifidobacterium crudilactis TaxID=327277 RepID=UPI0026492E5E